MESEVKNENKPRSLNKEQFEILKSLKLKEDNKAIQKEEDEIKELIHTINATQALNDLTSAALDVGLLDDLKSDTMVGDASSIKRILDEEKNEPKIETTSTEIDKDFFTSSLGFTKRDFEDLKSINQNIKKSNKFIIILLITIIALITVGVIIFFVVNR